MDYLDRLIKQCHTAAGPYLRPFAPNPAWQSAEVFLIGDNPATPLREEFASFDAYWAGLTVDPNLFRRVYREARGGEPSKTTRETNNFLQALAQRNVLITNVCWFPARRSSEVPDCELGRDDRLYGLIQHCRPKVLFAHGKAARQFLEKYWRVSLDPGAPPHRNGVEVSGKLLLAYHHFSGQGIRSGGTFQPKTDIPAFAQRIEQFLAAQ